ncbi:uncharacterized protein TNCV_254921 [Trichonephila clavipes]|nr:uncharacterized protein TNCV_254921 [Trichonephila clavipes]
MRKIALTRILTGNWFLIGESQITWCFVITNSSHAAISSALVSGSRDLELEVNEDDIEDLIMGHENELTIEEFQEILNEEHQETQRNVSPSEQEEDERGPMPTSTIKDFLKSGMMSDQWS